MLNIENYYFDYGLLKKYQNYLEELMFIPVNEEELNSQILLVDENYIDKIEEIIQKPLRYKIIGKEEFSFFLRDFDIKLKIYRLSSIRVDNRFIEDDIVEDFYQYLFKFALKKRSSDIHIEACESSFIIRLRIDGILHQFFKFSRELFDVVSSVIKMKCNLDITQKRLYQNGRLSESIDEKSVDFRISTMPIIDGESIVIRILEADNNRFRLDDLNIMSNELNVIKKRIKTTTGLVLVTGPTGSGKSSTLYALMQELNSTAKKIISIEEPIEYKIKGIQQIAVNEEIGLTYLEILKNILRQDPDIIVIGEVRDKESLEIAIQASLTGHLVITTLHTNSAVETITRLLDLDAKPYLISSVLKMIIAQRLVRKLCPNCKLKVKNSYQKVGCSECNMSGYKSRVVLAEVLDIDENIAKMISSSQSVKEILQYAKSNLIFRSFEDIKDEMIIKGITTEEEINKVIL